MLNRIHNKFGLRTLKGRIILFYIVFSLVLALFIFSPLLFIGKEQRLVDAENEINRVIHIQKMFISNWLEEHLVQLKTMAEISRKNIDDDIFMTNMIEEIKKNHAGFDTVAYANKQGIIEETTSNITNIDVSSQDYFKEAKKGNAYISDAFYGKISKNKIVTFSAPVLDEQNNFNGVLVGAVKLETINEVMGNYKDESAETYITDNDGKFITNSSKGNFGEKIHSAIYEKAILHEEPNDMYESNDGEIVLGNYVWVNDDRWLIIGEKNKENIYAPFKGIVKIFILGYVVLALLGLCMILFLSQHIQKSIDRVLKGTRKIGNGEWGHRIEETKSDAQEFKELSHNFNKMADLIEEQVISLMESEEKFRTIAEYSSDIISVHENNGKFTYISPAAKEILQYDPDELIGKTGVHLVQEADKEQILKWYRKLDTSGYAVITFRIKRNDGTYIWIESSAKKIFSNDARLNQMYMFSRNITDRKKVEQQLKDIAVKDSLTAVYNRRAFNEDYEKVWGEAIQHDRSISLMMIDVDFFKKFNDCYGHLAGDDCLIEIARTMERIAQEEHGKVYRYGGEEFVVLLQNKNVQDTLNIAENIRSAIEQLKITQQVSENKPYVTVSIGVNHCVPTSNLSYMKFLEQTDAALYQVKNNGGNNIFYE